MVPEPSASISAQVIGIYPITLPYRNTRIGCSEPTSSAVRSAQRLMMFMDETKKIKKTEQRDMMDICNRVVAYRNTD